ncbi:hypothetical protein L596_013755 [Steinernema carpocapsae]|uniref:Uncharacterized protein n=1 Tax=Steinernema carpocapsae TaxID=34508 RepID=A0A4U5P1W2_STECR|nr:hypothetical protein L596_013755 [Steinernema carpocapsae]
MFSSNGNSLSKLHGVDISDHWIFVLADNKVRLNSEPECVVFSNFYGDGDYKLIVADKGTNRFNRTLMVIKDVTTIGLYPLTEMPSGIVSFSTEIQFKDDPIVASIAVATSTSVLIFKNLKPFYKYSPPALDPNPDEKKAWEKFDDRYINPAQLHLILSKIKETIGMSSLSGRSQNYLVLPESDRDEFLNAFSGKPLNRPQTISAMTSLKKSSLDLDTSVAFVIATETGHIYIVDPSAYHVLAHVKIPSAPVFLVTYGVYNDNYKIAVVTRDSEVFIMKRGTVSEKPVISTATDIVSACMVKKLLILACIDYTVSFYTLKGALHHRMQLDKPVIGLEPFFYASKQYSGVFVVHQKEIKLYTDLNLVDTIRTQKPIKWIKFGKYGREDGNLVIGFQGRGLAIATFRRTADLEAVSKARQMMANVPQKKSAFIPKKTELYIVNTVRERQNAEQMHAIYQRDLLMLKLDTAKTYNNLVSNPTAKTDTVKAHESVEFTVDVNGFGPEFVVRSTVKSKLSMDPNITRSIVIQYDSKIYKVPESLICLPPLIHGHTYNFSAKVTVLHPEAFQSQDIRVLLVEKGRSVALSMVVVTMPISELPMFD